MPAERAPDLFEAAAQQELASRAPLAHRLRPRSLDEVAGQQHLLGRGAPLRRLVEAGRLSSALFFGPPGTGKTTVARLVADRDRAEFVQLSAVVAGVKEVREVIDAARRRLGMEGRSTVLFLDEIHRFSRAQQDALLPGVEEGVIVLVGATTENPFFSLTAPLLSRMTLFRFQPLTVPELEQVARRALALEGAEVDDDALAFCCELADGDARSVLTTLDVALALVRTVDTSRSRIDRAAIEAARTTRVVRFGQDEHYDLVSAFIKSIRGSDANAGVYWLARLLAGGEDPRFIARRLVILASEDVGNADPMALVIAVSAAEALERVGLPEASLNLTQAVTYLALAPKSNAVVVAYGEAHHDVEHGEDQPVPARLRDASYRGAHQLGHGVGYEYPHDDPRGYVDAAYLPDGLAGRRYYRPVRGVEVRLAEALDRLRRPNEGVATNDSNDDEMDEGRMDR